MVRLSTSRHGHGSAACVSATVVSVHVPRLSGGVSVNVAWRLHPLASMSSSCCSSPAFPSVRVEICISCSMRACVSSAGAGLWVNVLLSICYVPLLLQLWPCISSALPLRVSSLSLSICCRWELCASALTLVLPSSPVNSVSLSVSLLPISHSHSPTNSLELYWQTRWIVLPSHYSLKLNEDAILKYAFSPFPSSLLLSKASILFHVILICPFLCCVILVSFFCSHPPSFYFWRISFFQIPISALVAPLDPLIPPLFNLYPCKIHAGRCLSPSFFTPCLHQSLSVHFLLL